MGALEGSPWLSRRPFLAPRQAVQVLIQRQHPDPRLGRQSRPPQKRNHVGVNPAAWA